MTRYVQFVVTAIILGVAGSTALAASPTVILPGVSAPVQHIVRRGEFIIGIASQYRDIAWDDIIDANEGYLRTHYDRVCKKFSKRFRHRPLKQGYYCNDRLKRPYASTIQAGWRLTIPVGIAPTEANVLVSEFAGDKPLILVQTQNNNQSDAQNALGMYISALQRYRRTPASICLGEGANISCHDATPNSPTTQTSVIAALDQNAADSLVIISDNNTVASVIDGLSEVKITIVCLSMLEEKTKGCSELGERIQAQGGAFAEYQHWSRSNYWNYLSSAGMLSIAKAKRLISRVGYHNIENRREDIKRIYAVPDAGP